MQVASIAKNLANFARLDGVADCHDQDAVWRCLERMMETDARDAKDVLALLATVRTLMNANAAPMETQEGYGQHCALMLLRNAISAVENMAGERSAAYTGYEWQ